MRLSVAPLAGAWIETAKESGKGVAIESHPLRVRGLKLDLSGQQALDHESHPLRVRGLKPDAEGFVQQLFPVAPLAGAWIETVLSMQFRKVTASHPLRVRGLKLP